MSQIAEESRFSAQLYLRYRLEIMVGERGPVAIMSEIPSLKRSHGLNQLGAEVISR